MEYLTTEEVIRIHQRMIDELGGESGILMMGNLKFISSLMDDRYLVDFDLYTLAAKLMSNLIRGHPFVDGNKRTGFEAGDSFLRKNGRKIKCTPEEGLEFTLRIARNEINDKEITDWLMKHTTIY